MVLASIVHREGQEGDVARALDGEHELALVLRACARDAARDDLAALGDEIAQGLRIFVVDARRLAGALSAAERAAAAPAAPGRRNGIRVAGLLSHALLFAFHQSSPPRFAAAISSSPASSASSA